MAYRPVHHQSISFTSKYPNGLKGYLWSTSLLPQLQEQSAPSQKSTFDSFYNPNYIFHSKKPIEKSTSGPAFISSQLMLICDKNPKLNHHTSFLSPRSCLRIINSKNGGSEQSEGKRRRALLPKETRAIH